MAILITAVFATLGFWFTLLGFPMPEDEEDS